MHVSHVKMLFFALAELIIGLRHSFLEVQENAGRVRVCVEITQPADKAIEREIFLVASTQPGSAGKSQQEVW